MKQRKVVVIGGGTGIFPVTTALKHLDVSITTIVAVSDSGGSTGRIRDEFGFQPVGDLRQSLAALAEDEGQQWIRKLLLYRFKKGTGLKGHNLGNLILTALQDMTGTTSEALLRAMQIFRLEGEVIPATNEMVDLKITYTDGSSAIGEHILDETSDTVRKIDHISLEPEASANPHAIKAIEQADSIIIGPGDYYASILAALAPNSLSETIATSKATLVYICNLMTRKTQTHDMSAADHVAGIEKILGRPVDAILFNNEQIPAAILTAYAKEGEYPVVDDLLDDDRVVRQSLLLDEVFLKETNDTAHRSLLRHDSQKLQKALAALVV